MNELKTKNEKKREIRTKKICINYLELMQTLGNASSTRVIAHLAEKFEMTIPGIRWILQKENILITSYPRKKILRLAKGFNEELYKILEKDIPARAKTDEIETIVYQKTNDSIVRNDCKLLIDMLKNNEEE